MMPSVAVRVAIFSRNCSTVEGLMATAPFAPFSGSCLDPISITSSSCVAVEIAILMRTYCCGHGSDGNLQALFERDEHVVPQNFAGLGDIGQGVAHVALAGRGVGRPRLDARQRCELSQHLVDR